MQQNEQTVVVNETVFRRWDYLAFSVLTAINVVVVGWFLYYWFSPERWQAGSIVLWLFTFQLMYWLAVQQFRWCLLPFMKKPRWMSASPGWKVGVAMTFVPGLESIEMLEKTVAALVAMTYPHDTWVLDEGDDDGVKALCLRLGARHFTRKHLKQYQTANGPFEARTKHGNYNAWSEEVGYARYEIITGFDPDHVPYPEFLNQVLGFFNDPRVAYVQAPQVYYNQDASFVARGAAEETYSYYSSTQMASYHMSFPIITGCHHSHRVTALKQVGGFAAHDADDLLITLLYRAAGGIPAEDSGEGDHSGGLDRLPDSATSLGTVGARREVSSLSQARGPFAPSTRLMSALHGIFYVQDGVSGLLSVCLLAFMLVSGWAPTFLTLDTFGYLMLMFLVLQLIDLYQQWFFLDRRREWGFQWRTAVLRAGKWPYVLLGIIGAVSGTKQPYSLTIKVKTESKRYMLLVPHLMIVAVLAAAWLIGLALGQYHHPLLIVPVVFMIALSLGLIWTDTWKFPDPFELKLWQSSLVDDPQAGRAEWVRASDGALNEPR